MLMKFILREEQIQKHDLSLLKKTVSQAREELDKILNVRLRDFANPEAKFNQICMKVHNALYNGLYFTKYKLFPMPSVIKEASDELWNILTRPPGCSISQFQAYVTRVQDICMWLDISYDLQVYPTFYHSENWSESLEFPNSRAINTEKTPLKATIRGLQNKDIDKIKDLQAAYFTSPEDVRDLEDCSTYVAEAESKFAGFILYSFDKSAHSPKIEIRSMAVAPEMTGRTIGGQLLAHITLLSDKNSGIPIKAIVPETNRPAIKFFSQHGFIAKRKLHTFEYSGEKGIVFVRNTQE